MTSPHPAGPPPGVSRREWRERNQGQSSTSAPASATEPASALADILGGGAGTARTTAQPTILTVCTGNICRSAMAEVLLRTRIEPLGVRVHSAGTHALVGHGLPDPARDIALRAGADPAMVEAHAARYLIEPFLGDADLILTMAREHRSFVVKMMPNRLRRTFTVREFARLASTLSTDEARATADAAGDVAHDRFAAVLQAVAAQRGLTAALADDDDVIDPYRRSLETYELSASQLLPALDEVERVIRAALA